MSAHPGRVPRTILVGSDGSDGALSATEWAADLAAMSDARVSVVHVLTYNREFVRDLTFDTMTTWRRTLEDALQRSWIAPVRERGVRYRSSIVEDESPAGGLIRAAARDDADLIVVGARRRHTIASRVRSSISWSLTHHAGRPVVVVPPGWGETSPSEEVTTATTLCDPPRARVRPR